MNELDTYLNSKQLSKALGLSRSGIFSLVRRGILPKGILIGRSRRWNMAELQTFLKEGTKREQ